MPEADLTIKLPAGSPGLLGWPESLKGQAERSEPTE